MPVVPNHDQQLILRSDDKVLMVRAVAGAGKTTTLALVAKGACDSGVAPHQICSLSFSAGARTRFRQKLVEEGASSKIVVATVEEFAWNNIARLAALNYLDLPQLYRADEEIRPHIIAAAELVGRQYAEVGSEFDFSFKDHSPRVEELVNLLARLKASLATLRFDDEEFGRDDMRELADQFGVPKEALEICREYERRRRPASGQFLWASPADVVTDLVALLRLHPLAINRIPKAALMLIDEWHDINAAEFDLVTRLRRGARLVAVGDKDQVINEARGANTRFSSSEFDLAFPLATSMKLDKSHRFGSSVSKLASAIIGRSCFSHAEPYTTITRMSYDPANGNDCAVQVATQVKALVEARAGTTLSDIAIIVREADQSIEIENALLDQNLAYCCDSFESYLFRPEVLMLRGLLHIASGNYETLVDDKETCERMVLALDSYFSVSDDPRHWPEDYLENSRKWRKPTPFEHAQQTIAAEPSALRWYFEGVLCKEQEFDSPSTRRWKERFATVVHNLRAKCGSATAGELLAYASGALDVASVTRRAFVSRHHADSAVRSIRAFSSFAGSESKSAVAFLQDIHHRQLRVGGKMSGGRNRRQLTLTTVQGAKGREWPFVLIPYLQAGHFPRGTDLNQERRFFYVAITRVMAGLVLFEPDDAHAHLRGNMVR